MSSSEGAFDEHMIDQGIPEERSACPIAGASYVHRREAIAHSTGIPALLTQIRACTVCAAHLPTRPRPIVQASSTARIVIIGQAPGRRVHECGVPWADASGARLRQWLGMTDEEFYDPARTALVPMGFCFPGAGPSGDLPPRREWAPLWHEPLLAFLPADRLTVIIDAYAQQRYAGETRGTVTDTVGRWRDFLPHRIVMPHPSPRNRRWLATNPWFEAEAVPAVRTRVRTIIDDSREPE